MAVLLCPSPLPSFRNLLARDDDDERAGDVSCYHRCRRGDAVRHEVVVKHVLSKRQARQGLDGIGSSSSISRAAEVVVIVVVIVNGRKHRESSSSETSTSSVQVHITCYVMLCGSCRA